jgi:hypothetical protein
MCRSAVALCFAFSGDSVDTDNSGGKGCVSALGLSVWRICILKCWNGIQRSLVANGRLKITTFRSLISYNQWACGHVNQIWLWFLLRCLDYASCCGLYYVNQLVWSCNVLCCSRAWFTKWRVLVYCNWRNHLSAESLSMCLNHVACVL